jgi:hypothetical protein
MGLILAPIRADKVSSWVDFVSEVGGARKAEFEQFNQRHRLTKHEAWLCETPAGSFACVIHEGPGAPELIQNIARSTQEFDRWFASKLGEIHGMDLTKPPPGKPPERKLSWSA